MSRDSTALGREMATKSLGRKGGTGGAHLHICK